MNFSSFTRSLSYTDERAVYPRRCCRAVSAGEATGAGTYPSSAIRLNSGLGQAFFSWYSAHADAASAFFTRNVLASIDAAFTSHRSLTGVCPGDAGTEME
jgi:hypothetical protein